MIAGLNASRLFPALRLAAAITTGVLASASVANAQSGFAILHSFAGYDGALPYAGLIQGPDGTLYGTTFSGGDFNSTGAVFRLAPDGSGFTILHNFAVSPNDGAGPYAGLIQGPDGTLYGTTLSGGNSLSARGVVFQLTLSPNVPKRR